MLSFCCCGVVLRAMLPVLVEGPAAERRDQEIGPDRRSVTWSAESPCQVSAGVGLREMAVSPRSCRAGRVCRVNRQAGAGPLHCLGAVVDLEFGEYVAYVVSDGFG